ncbi:MAG: alpha/beta hydrolase [Pseudomonadota bacterium]|nr:alpha/beta hydrolase [Pseudomonadota bacterium]
MPPRLSLRSHLFRLAVRSLIVPCISGYAPVAKRRARLELTTRLTRLPLPAGTQVEPTTFRGVPGEWVRNLRITPKRTVLYLHGGAYAIGSPAVYREYMAQMARQWQAQVAVIDYRMAPEHPFPAALDDAIAAYQSLLESGVAATDLVVAGDSAGGGLTLACALKARELGLSQPDALAVVAPWTDLTMSGESAQKVRDDMLFNATMNIAAKDYLAGAPATTPLASPLYADLRGLPRTLIQVTDTELLLSDATRLDTALRAAGVGSVLRVWKGLWHVWPLFAGKLPEADAALREAAEFLDGPARP